MYKLAFPSYDSTGAPNVMPTFNIEQHKIAAALDTYAKHNGRCPNHSEGLRVLLVNTNDSKNWRGPYIEKTSINDTMYVTALVKASGSKGANRNDDFTLLPFCDENSEAK
jgi:hypothetical protein